MNMQARNPFGITKATDLTDREIRVTWVDLPGGDGFFAQYDPASPMPMVLLGGKGCGRTHLMRYFSYSLQELRAGQTSILEVIRKEGYLGIYFRCEGLDAERFASKGQPQEVWDAIFPYYMDLWLAQLTLDTISRVLSRGGILKRVERDVCKGIIRLFDTAEFKEINTIDALSEELHELQREIDIAVNNAPVTRQLRLPLIRVTRGVLVFGIPRVIADVVQEFKDIQFLYLVDEFENLLVSQQRYINTLIRERKFPVSFKVGARLHGFRTRGTLSGGEENREGSEYEARYLDEQLRASANYAAFAKRLVMRRLVNAGYFDNLDESTPLEVTLAEQFEDIPRGDFFKHATRFIDENYQSSERPYIATLEANLRSAVERALAPGVTSEKDIEKIINELRVPEYPLLEKTNTFLLYQDWAGRANLVKAAIDIAKSCRGYIFNNEDGGRHKRTLGHFRTDLLAQMLREARQGQRYLGLDTFIDMAGGLPRHLLIILKHVYGWAIFNGEQPFRGQPISIRSQQQGVHEASDWFYHDAKATGPHAQALETSIGQLARLFHSLRFSDKPVEPSLNTFSFIDQECSENARRCIELGEEYSLLLRVAGGQKDRNDRGVVPKYQLNPMLCPRYDLPIGRRGAISLSGNEINAIFDEKHFGEFEEALRVRLERVNAPFLKAGSGSGSRGGRRNKEQAALPGF